MTKKEVKKTQAKYRRSKKELFELFKNHDLAKCPLYASHGVKNRACEIWDELWETVAALEAVEVEDADKLE